VCLSFVYSALVHPLLTFSLHDALPIFVEDLVRAVVDAALVEHRTGLAELHDDALADLVGELTLGGQALGGALAPLVHLVAVDQGRAGPVVHGGLDVAAILTADGRAARSAAVLP